MTVVTSVTFGVTELRGQTVFYTHRNDVINTCEIQLCTIYDAHSTVHALYNVYREA